MNLIDSFSAYSQWRDRSAVAVERLRNWLQSNRLGDAQGEMRLQYALNRLREDQLTVAFVAEFSRGKSELINAIFFSGYGDRILPSSAGRTTMCPTELQWSPGDTPGIALLPIDSRATHASVAELKRYPEEWISSELDANSSESLRSALARVGETRWVDKDRAVELGFAIDPEGNTGLKPGADGLVEIPSWRHAVIRFPHPLLEKGLVILDTPGLNAIGAEPELTLSLLPNAHAVLFVLAADTGVTQSDLAVWREYVSAGRGSRRGCLVALNKIDGLWDGLRNQARIDEEIARQVESVSRTLDIEASQVFPVSAQKALVARIGHDATLLARSELERLETALIEDLLPTKQDLVRESTLGEADDLVRQTRELLNARLAGIREQLQELTDLRGKNQSVIEYMMRKVKSEKEEFEQGLQKYYAVRSVFSNMTNSLLAHLGLDALRDETRRTREAMLDSSFSKGLRDAMLNFFASLRGNLHRSTDEIGEITRMLEAMYKRFTVEHGLKLTPPNSFSTLRYEKEIDRLEKAFNSQFNTVLNIVTTEKHALTQKFFETIAVQARRTFEVANRDVENWLRAVMSPLETQVREYQLQLKRRLESVKRIHQATDTLEERIVELQQSEQGVLHELEELTRLSNEIHLELNRDVTDPDHMLETRAA
ncbi:MAG: dynamin family protein [Rhodocyclaceae bacterium]|nr:dynamin family protein [Rhodocyclaceae bacterium]MCP5232852.1 dynamin family protein [Zoogloeaceae bacterium]MCB1911822.1 dynamin family protein [Rhodocyclaceae bacterium]MCP5238214.1 dynamin family protein [Zoogloeaceae bacterium]MCP5255415.1 dynamin family protein [Zoogloeaceae bacterium]